MSTPTFAYALPWSYPGHGSRWGSSFPFAPACLARGGLIHVGTTDAEHAPAAGGDPGGTLALVRSAPPRMAFALADPAGTPEEDFSLVFADAVTLAQAGDRPAARKLLKDADRRAPIDALLCRGFIELTWTVGRGETRFREAVARAEGCLRPGFCGALPWTEPANRAFLAALRCLAWTRWRAGDAGEARRILDSLLWLDPADAQEAADWLALVDAGVEADGPAFPALPDDWWWIAPPAYRDRWDRYDDRFPEGWT